MLAVGCYALFELYMGSANKHLLEHIFLEKGNILCNVMNVYVNASLDCWKMQLSKSRYSSAGSKG